jgi:ankyrin repeat protein
MCEQDKEKMETKSRIIDSMNLRLEQRFLSLCQVRKSRLMESLKRHLILPSSQFKQEKVLMFPVNDLQAARGGDADQIAMLARQGANLDQVDYDGRTAMHKACLEGNHKCVEVLIQNYADVNIKDRWGQVTLKLSTKSWKSCKCVQYFLF